MGSLFSSRAQKEDKNEVSANSAASVENSTNTETVFRVGDGKIHNRACFGAGCYWGTEKFFKINFARQMYPESMIKNTFVGKYLSSPPTSPNITCS